MKWFCSAVVLVAVWVAAGCSGPVGPPTPIGFVPTVPTPTRAAAVSAPAPATGAGSPSPVAGAASPSPSATPGLTGPPLPTAIVGSPSLPPNAPQAGQPYSFQQFVAAVRAQGVAVRPSTQELQVPYFRVMGATFFADDDQVVVFVYPDPAAREADSAKIDSEITRNEEDQPVRKIGDRAYPWRGKPNFYWRGNLLVQFVSDKDDTAAKLQQALEGLERATSR